MESGDLIEEEKSREENHHVDQEGPEVYQHGNEIKHDIGKQLSRKKLLKNHTFNLEAGGSTTNQGPGSPQVRFFSFLFFFPFPPFL